MTGSRSEWRPKLIALTMASSLVVMSLGACQSIERETGVSEEAQIGAGAGAAAGGILALIFDANPGWIAASVILGAVAGGFLADYLTEEDAASHGETQYRALETLGAGETAEWTNEQSGNRGRTTVHEVFQMTDGTVCKNFTETVEAGGETINRSGTACKEPGAVWKVRGSS